MMPQAPHGQIQMKKYESETDLYSMDFMYSCILRRYIDWPFTCARFGPHTSANRDYATYQFFLAYRTDSEYNKTNRTWNKVGSCIIIGSAELADEGSCFLEDYECFYGIEDHKKLGRGLNGGLDFTHFLVRVDLTTRSMRTKWTESKFVKKTLGSSLLPVTPPKYTYGTLLSRSPTSKTTILKRDTALTSQTWCKVVLARLMSSIDSSFNNAMKWQPESYMVVAGTENGYLMNWNLESLNKTKTSLHNSDNTTGSTKINHQNFISLHQSVTHSLSRK